ncbi:hypothetical protein ACO0RG_001794 [Hanseniaspora osmophila]
MEFDEFGNPENKLEVLDTNTILDNTTTNTIPEDTTANTKNNVSVSIETQEPSKSTPILRKTQTKIENGHFYNKPPRYTFDKEYLGQLATIPERILNIGVVGPHKSGKTMLASSILTKYYRHHHNDISSVKSVNYYLDNLKIEIERNCSTKLNGGKFLGQDFSEKSWYCNLLDFPGHVDFWDELSIGLQLCDTFCIVIDCCEGVTSIVQKLYWMVKKQNKKIIFVINKVDRLMLELRLDPSSAYLKLKSIVNDINAMTAQGDYYSPEENNVLFASGKMNFIFSVKEFVTKFYYKSLSRNMSNVNEFAKRMWGNVSFTNGKFSKLGEINHVPTFVEFILAPLYKIVTHSLSLEPKELAKWLLANLKIDYNPISNSEYNAQLKSVFQTIFDTHDGLIDAIVCCVKKLEFVENGFEMQESSLTIAHVVKAVDYCGEIWSLVKVHKGIVNTSTQYIIAAPRTSASLSWNDKDSFDENNSVFTVASIATMGGRFLEHTNCAYENQVVLVKGLHEHINKSATLISYDPDEKPKSYKKLVFEAIPRVNEPICKIVLQPYHPRESSFLVKSLNLINKMYPNALIKVEDSGEQTLFGTGELYLDTILYDLRHVYTQPPIEIKTTANAVTSFKESVSKQSFASIPISSKNFEISITAQPMNYELVRDLTGGAFLPHKYIEDNKWSQLKRTLRQTYGWDVDTSKKCWAFEGTNCFIDDTMPETTDESLLENPYKRSILQGFEWCCQAGPLAEEPLHGVQFKLLKIQKLNDSSKASMSELIALVKRACFVGILTAQPVIYEPIYEIDVMTNTPYQKNIEALIKKRRGGKFYNVVPIQGTPLLELRGQVPVIDSYGLDVDIKMSCNGSAIVQMHTEAHIWRKVPGSVMDYSCSLPKLEPAPYESLSRDFVMKTRRRKGLDDDSSSVNPEDEGPSLKKYIDLDLYEKLKQADLI